MYQPIRMPNTLMTIILCLSTSIGLAQLKDSTDHPLEIIDDADEIATLHELILSNWLNYPRIAQSYAQKSIDLSTQIGDSVLISKSLRLMAGVYYYKGDYETSLSFNQQALGIAMSLQNEELINNCYNNIGLIYYYLGSYPQALEYLMLSIQIKDKLGTLYGKSTTLNNIGLVYEKNGKYDEARDYFSEALALSQSMADSNLMVYSNNNIGLTWIRKNQPETAKIYFLRAREIANKTNNVYWGSAALRGLGEVSQQQGDLAAAQQYFTAGLRESQTIGDKQGIAESYSLLGENYLLRKQFQEAKMMLDSSQYFALMIKSVHSIQANLRQYISLEEARSNLEGVVARQQDYVDFKDSLFQEIMNRNLIMVPEKLEEDARRVAMEAQIKEIENYRMIERIYLIIVLFSIPVIVVLILLLKKIRTSNMDLRKKNEEIEAQSFEIEAQNLKLNLSIKQLRRTQNLLTESEKMASIGQLVGGLAHELNNPLNFIGGVIRPMEMNLKDLETYAEEIKDSEPYREIQMLLEGVAEGTERASGVIDKLKELSPKLRTEEKERFDFADCVEETIELLEKDFSKLNCINNLVTGPLPIVSNYYEITKILYALLHNAVEAVVQNITKNRNVYIEAEVSDQTLKIIVQDNGSGIKESDQKKIFDPFFTTKNQQGASGLGLFVAQTLIERNKGKISVESEVGKGSTFTVHLPT